MYFQFVADTKISPYHVFTYIISLMMLTGKNYGQMKLHSFRKVRILTFGLLLHQINSL